MKLNLPAMACPREEKKKEKEKKIREKI